MLRIRRSIRLITVVVVMAVVTAVGEQAARADDANAWAVGSPRLHTGPGVGFPIVASLKYKSPVVLEARNSDSSWLLVHEASGSGRGWGEKVLFQFAPDVKLSALPLSTDEIGKGSQNPKLPALPSNLSAGDLLAPSVAQLTPRILGVMRAIYH